MGKILLDDALLREPTGQYRPLFAIVENHLLNGTRTLCVCICTCMNMDSLEGWVLVKCGGGNLFQMPNGKQTMVIAHTHKHIATHKKICVNANFVHKYRFLQRDGDLAESMYEHMNHHWYKMWLRHKMLLCAKQTHINIHTHCNTHACLTLKQRFVSYIHMIHQPSKSFLSVSSKPTPATNTLPLPTPEMNIHALSN